MKKLLLGVFVTALVLSCGPDYYDSVVSNKTETVMVTYTYAGSRDILQSGESKSYSVALDEINIEDVDLDEHHPKSVLLTHDGFDYIFTDVTPIPLRVKNHTGEDVTITCDYLDSNPSGTYSTSLRLEGAGQSGDEKNGIIYTVTPVFSIACTSNTAYTVAYTVSDTEIYVEIH
jgi:hypothetical protein